MKTVDEKNIEELGHIFAKTKRLAGSVDLSVSIDSRQLRRILERCAKENFIVELCELTAHHPHANAAVLNKIFELSKGDFGVLNTLASLQKCPKLLLERLALSELRSVSEHAKINLVRRGLARARKDELMALLARHSGDGYLDTGIRAAVASSPKSAVSIIKMLANDDVDSIAELAKDNFDRRLRPEKAKQITRVRR